MSSCLVVGGGFLGSHVARRLSLEGHTVRVYSRSFNEWLLHEDRSGEGRIELVEGTLPDGRGLPELIDVADVLFYMAGSSTPAMAQSDPGGSITRSVVPAAAVLDLMRLTNTRRVVIASSGGTVYGAPTQLPTDETHPPRPISLHGHNSLTIERYAAFFAERYGFEPIVMRYSNPYGPGQLARHGQGVIAAWCDALAHDEPITVFGGAGVKRDFVFVEDAVEATVLAGLRAEGPVVYNVGSETSVSLAELLELLQRVTGREAEIRDVPARGVDVPATQLDCTKIRSELGWHALTSLGDGIRSSWDWESQLPYGRRTETR